MSRKNKRKQSKKYLPKYGAKIKPDEVFNYGPLSIARYGRYIQFSNNATPEEHAEMLKRASESHKKIIVELEDAVTNLQTTISKYDAVDIMHRAVYMLLPLFLKYQSEFEYSKDENYYLPTIEYLQYLIARTPVAKTSIELSEKEWDILWEQAIKVLQLTEAYLFTRPRSQDPPDEIDALRYEIDSRRLMVRVKRYPVFLSDYLRDSLLPFEGSIKETYGISVDEIIKGIGQIDEYQKNGVTSRYKDMALTTTDLMAKLKKAGFNTSEDGSSEDIEKMKQALETDEFKNLHEEGQEKARLTFTAAAFDITDVSQLPKDFLSMLSVKPGESILTKLTGDDNEDLSPLSPSVLHYKPFLEVDGKIYTFYHSGFEDHIAEIIEADLFAKKPKQRTKLETARSDYIEEKAKELLTSNLSNDFVLQNVYYPNPDKPGNTELDILAGADDILFLVEVKSGGISAGASRGAPKDIASNLSDLIIAGQRQSERAERYIKSKDEVEFYDKSGKNVIHKISHKDYRKIFRIVVTKEDLGWVGAKIAQLSILDPGLSKSYPWHISLDDLRVVAELFSDSDIRFIHYLEQRLAASSEESLMQHDEIEHIGLYNKINHYHDLPIKDANRVSFDASYLQDIDHYFVERNAGKKPSIPTQDIPTRIKEVIYALTSSKLKHRFEAGSLLLSFDGESREGLEQALETIDQSNNEGKQRSVRIPFNAESVGITITYATGKNWEDELLRSAAQMQQSECTLWIVLQLTGDPQGVIGDIQRIVPGQYSDDDIKKGLAANEKGLQARINSRKIGRNEKCPCGSGKKYKKCHGSVL